MAGLTQSPFTLVRAVDVPIEPGSAAAALQAVGSTPVVQVGAGGYNDLVDAASRGMFRCYRIQLANTRVAVAAADDFGSVQLLAFPNAPQWIVAGWISAAFVKQNNTNGIVSATQPNVALGTAAATASTLAGTMINVMNQTQVATGVTGNHTNATLAGGATPALTLIAAGASNGVWLNAAAAITADSGISFTGEARIWTLDLGAF